VPNTVVVSSTDPPTVTVTPADSLTVSVTQEAGPTVAVSKTDPPTVTVSATAPGFSAANARDSVSATSPLSYNSSTGVFSYTEATHVLNDLTNVSVSSPGIHEYLKWNGVSAWVPDAIEIAHVTSLQSTLDGKAASSHTHSISNVTDLQTTLDSKKNKEVIGITVDGGGTVLTAGVKGHRRIPYACTVKQINLICDQSGSVSFTIRTRASGAITGTSATTDVVAVSSAQTAEITSGFDDATIAADDMFEFEITGTPATVTRATVMVELEES